MGTFKQVFSSEFVADTTQAQTSVARLGATIASLGPLMNSSMAAVSSIAKMAAIGFAGVTAAAMGSVLLVSEFNKNLVHAAALGDLNKTQMAALGNEIVGLSVKYGQAASAIADGVVTLTKAGLTNEEIAMSMDSITQAMMANAISFEEAANIAVYATKQFGGGAGFSNLTTLMDKMQKVTQETVMDFTDLQQGLAYAGSTAMLANVSFDQLLAMLGTLSQRAMEAGIGARSLNQMMLSLIEKAPEMQEWLDEMGAGFQLITDEGLQVDKVLRFFNGMDSGFKELIKSTDIFTKRGLRSWGLLITGGDEYLKLLEQDLPGAAGTLEKVYKKQTESISFQLKQMLRMLTAPFLASEFQEKITGWMSDPKIKKGVKDIGELLSKYIWAFLEWTIKNSSKLIDFVKSAIEFSFNLLEPLYNIGQLLMGMGDFLFRVYMTYKIMMGMGLRAFMDGITRSYAMRNRAQATSIALAEKDVLTTGMQIQQSRLHTQAMMAERAMYLQMAGAMITAATSAFVLGKAMGFDPTTAITSTLMSTVMGMYLGGMVTGGSPWGIAGGGILMGGTTLATYLIAASQHKEIEKPKLSTANLSYSTSPSSYSLGTAPSSQTGSTTNVTVNVNGYVGNEEKLAKMTDRYIAARINGGR